MNEVSVIFPNQLFKSHPAIHKSREIWLVEDPRYFTDFKFHKQKLILHRSSMKTYQDWLLSLGYDVKYIEYKKDLFKELKHRNINCIHFCSPVDNKLENHIKVMSKEYKIQLKNHDSPMFLTPENIFDELFREKEHYSMTSFYIHQRKRLKILLDKKGKALGGKWSFDPENRKKMPENIKIPEIKKYGKNKYIKEAKQYVEKNFPANYGETKDFIYPIMFDEINFWLEDFLKKKLNLFGDYEDAMTEKDNYLFHSVLSYALNIGLLTPKEVIDKTLNFANKHKVPLNSLEGFIRQITGWREFVRGVYYLKEYEQRNSNYWNHHHTLPTTFYSAQTGIEPVDKSIKNALKTGYCHHIERLMILGNFMLLCEIHPNEVYKWFMELFIDSYDWVMVPNVYGMSQFSDGGLMMTKPYLSSSNYIKKMSDYREGEWCEIWDGLYWRFIAKHIDFFEKNPRLRIMTTYLTRISEDKLNNHIKIADNFLEKLWKT